MLLTSAVQGSGSRRLVQPSSTQSPKHTETNRNTLCSYTCVLVIKLTYWYKDTFVQKLLHTPLVFQSVNTAYYVAAMLGSKKKKIRKETVNKSFNYDRCYIQLPTDAETPSARNICIKMRRWCYCALTGVRQRLLCWAGYSARVDGGGDSVAGVRRWKSNNE